VTLDGKPLPNAVVTFQPLRDGNNVNPGPGSDALTDADGNYTLKVVGSGKTGAVVGKHRVETSAYPSAPGADPTADRPGGGAARNLVPPQYNAKTTLTFDVPRGHDGGELRPEVEAVGAGARAGGKCHGPAANGKGKAASNGPAGGRVLRRRSRSWLLSLLPGRGIPWPLLAPCGVEMNKGLRRRSPLSVHRVTCPVICTPGRARTCNLRFRRPAYSRGKECDTKELRRDPPSGCTPGCTQGRGRVPRPRFVPFELIQCTRSRAEGDNRTARPRR
jgi:hypothetical protein